MLRLSTYVNINFETLYIAQKRALRSLLSLHPLTPVTFAFTWLLVNSIFDPLQVKLAVLVYKCANGIYDSSIITLPLHSFLCSLRMDSLTLKLPVPRTNFGQFTLAFSGAKVWNSLPLNTCQATSIRNLVIQFIHASNTYT